MKLLFYVIFIFVISMRNCEAKCKFGDVNFKEENDDEDILKHYLKFKVSFRNLWDNIMRGRYFDPVTNLLTTDKQSLCECVYEKLHKKDTEPHDLNEQYARYPKRSLYQLCDKKGKSIQKFEFMVTCVVDKKTFFLSQGYQSYEDINIHDVYVFEPNGEIEWMQFKGMIEKLDFSNIDKNPAYSKFFSHFWNANSVYKHE